MGYYCHVKCLYQMCTKRVKKQYQKQAKIGDKNHIKNPQKPLNNRVSRGLVQRLLYNKVSYSDKQYFRRSKKSRNTIIQ